MPNKKRILIKISGEALKHTDNIFSLTKIDAIFRQIIELSKKYVVGIVVGGGNIWRGKMNNNFFSNADADYMGMTSTLINGIAIKSYLKSKNVKCILFSALALKNVTRNINIDEINQACKDNNILIFAGGTGHPYFTTDTCAALRAFDMQADLILMGKNNVDGVYNDDPRINKKAKFYSKLSYDKIITDNLQVMDLTALTLCKNKNIPIIVFDLLGKNGIINVANKKGKFTYISK